MSEGPPRGKVRAWLASLSPDQGYVFSKFVGAIIGGLLIVGMTLLPTTVIVAAMLISAFGGVAWGLVVAHRWATDDADHLAEDGHWFD